MPKWQGLCRGQGRRRLATLRRGQGRRRLAYVEGSRWCHVRPYAERNVVGVGTTPSAFSVRPKCDADGLYAEGHLPVVGTSPIRRG
jgi:hypothetical protein